MLAINHIIYLAVVFIFIKLFVDIYHEKSLSYSNNSIVYSTHVSLHSFHFQSKWQFVQSIYFSEQKQEERDFYQEISQNPPTRSIGIDLFNLSSLYLCAPRCHFNSSILLILNPTIYSHVLLGKSALKGKSAL